MGKSADGSAQQDEWWDERSNQKAVARSVARRGPNAPEGFPGGFAAVELGSGVTIPRTRCHASWGPLSLRNAPWQRIRTAVETIR